MTNPTKESTVKSDVTGQFLVNVETGETVGLTPAEGGEVYVPQGIFRPNHLVAFRSISGFEFRRCDTPLDADKKHS